MTKIEKLTGVLSDGQWHSTEELVQTVGHRFSATIHIAVHQHRYRIEKRRSNSRQFEYQLLVWDEAQLLNIQKLQNSF